MHIEYGQNAFIDENGQKLLGCPNEFFGTAIVCFIDILGFSNFVYKAFSQKSDMAINKFINIKNHSFIKSKGKESVMYGWNNLNGPTPEHLANAFYRPIVHTFSDSIVISAGLPKSIIVPDMVLAHLSLNVHISWIIKQALQEGFAIRGAIEIGEAYWNDKDIIGPAFINAYRIEREISKNVRIIYGPDYLMTLLSAQKNTELDLFSCMWKDCDGLIMLKPDIHAKEHRDYLKKRYQELQREAPSKKDIGKYDNVIKYFSTNQEMPSACNFSLDYIPELLNRYRYGA